MSAGDLDTTFNSPIGYLIKQYTNGYATYGNSVVIDSIGRIVVTGATRNNTNIYSGFVTRYLTDGTVDTGFNGGVIIKQQYTPGNITVGRSVAIDSSGRIIVTGMTYNITNTSNMFITRYLTDGTLDTSFNGGFITTQYTYGYYTSGTSVAIDSDDRIIVTGETRNTTNTSSIFITRYLADGTLDTGFGGGLITKQYTIGKNTSGNSVTIDSIGRIIVTGETRNTTNTSSMFITRYLADGTLDTGFGGGVIIKQYTTGYNTSGNSVTIDSIDRIVVTGGTNNNANTSSMFITRYLTDGALDTGFDGGVIIKQYTTGYNTYGKSAAIDSIGRIVVTGGTNNNANIFSMFITRYLTDGTLDTSFNGGVITKQYTTGYYNIGNSAAIDSNNRIVVTGQANDNTTIANIFITRYIGDNVTTTTTTTTTLPPTTTSTTTEPPTTTTTTINLDIHNTIQFSIDADYSLISGIESENTYKENLINQIVYYTGAPNDTIEILSVTPGSIVNKICLPEVYVQALKNSVESGKFNININNITYYAIENSYIFLANTCLDNICFYKGTMILTPNGYRFIETLNDGDLIKTAQGKQIKITKIIKFIGNDKKCPLYILHRDSLEHNIPIVDLYMSEGHAYRYDKKWCHMKCSSTAMKLDIDNIEYYNIVLDNYLEHTLVANGLEVESLFNIKGLEMTWNCGTDNCKPIIKNKSFKH